MGEDDLVTSRIEAPHPQFEVLNAGVGGCGTVEAYVYLAREGVQFNHYLVLLMVFVWHVWKGEAMIVE